ncbi:hypothetical protein Tco_1221530 [Tanacetum coccineum]
MVCVGYVVGQNRLLGKEEIGWDLNMFVRGSRNGQTYGEFFKPCAYLAETTTAHWAPTLSHRSRICQVFMTHIGWYKRPTEQRKSAQSGKCKLLKPQSC